MGALLVSRARKQKRWKTANDRLCLPSCCCCFICAKAESYPAHGRLEFQPRPRVMRIILPHRNSSPAFFTTRSGHHAHARTHVPGGSPQITGMKDNRGKTVYLIPERKSADTVGGEEREEGKKAKKQDGGRVPACSFSVYSYTTSVEHPHLTYVTAAINTSVRSPASLFIYLFPPLSRDY